MKILVTGAGGFVGRYLTESLSSKGHEVVALDRNNNCSKDILSCDITFFEDVSRIVENVSPDQVFHLAGISHLYGSSPSDMYRINVTGTMNLLEALSRSGNRGRFVYISSSQVYGNVDRETLPADEDTQVAPENHYGASKAAAEALVAGYSRETGIESVILRPFNHTGAGQSSNFLLPKLVQAFSRKDAEIHLGNLDVSRDILDVRDVVSAYCAVSEMKEVQPLSCYNVASGHAVSFNDIFQLLVNVSGHEPEIIQEAALKRENEISIICGSSEKLKKETGWTPGYTIKDTVEWMLNESR